MKALNEYLLYSQFRPADHHLAGFFEKFNKLIILCQARKRYCDLSYALNNFGCRNQLNLLLQIRQHFVQHFVGDWMRMSDTNGITVTPCNSDQFFDLFTDKLSLLNMI